MSRTTRSRKETKRAGTFRKHNAVRRPRIDIWVGPKYYDARGEEYTPGMPSGVEVAVR